MALRGRLFSKLQESWPLQFHDEIDKIFDCCVTHLYGICYITMIWPIGYNFHRLWRLVVIQQLFYVKVLEKLPPGCHLLLLIDQIAFGI